MAWQPVNFEAGIYKDDSPLRAGARYVDGNRVRFVGGLPETIYGWEYASESTLLGICRGAFTWTDNSSNPYAAFGTHLREYAMDVDGSVTDITPATSYANNSMSFTTTNGSAVVTITGWTHSLVADQKFKLENSSVTSVGGVTIAGTFTVLTVESTTSITYTAASAATSSAGPTAATVDTTIYLAPGQADGLGGLGFGVGGYGSGTYGSSSTGYSLAPRTWAFDQWGQNLLGSPSGGGLYEWAPNVSATELVTNGNFTTNSTWSIGTGWSVGGLQAFKTIGTASDLQQNVTTSSNAWHLLVFDMTATAGSLQPYLGTLTIGSALTTSGRKWLPVFSDGGTDSLKFSADAAFGGRLRNVSLQVLTTAHLVPNAPTQIGSMFVTAERNVVACGSNLSGSYDPLQVDWSDAEDNQNWTVSSQTLAGGFKIPRGSRIVRGLPGARENLIWTDDGLWAMRYVGLPNVYEFIELGRGCGLIGPNAAALVGGVWYWMTPTGAIYAYGGGGVAAVPCTLSRDLKDNLSYVQQDKVYASRLIGKNYAEVWWFVPDIREGNECSRYVSIGTLEPNKPWMCGMFGRTAFVDASVFEFPLGVDTDGRIWFHEKDFTENGGPRSWSLTGGYATDTRGQLIVNGIRPDADDLQGGYTITPTSINRSVKGLTTRTYSAIQVNAMTGEKSCRVKGEQVGFTIAGNSAPTFWRMGFLEADIIVTGAKR